MQEIEKALQNLVDALKRNKELDRIKVTITLTKPKSSKAKSSGK